MKPTIWNRVPARVLALLAGAASLSRLLSQAVPQPPDIMAFQGMAIDGSGKVLGENSATNLPAVFRVFDAYTSGNLLWSEQHTMSIQGGMFAVLLGEGTARVGEPRPPLSSLFLSNTASDRYVELTLLGAGTGGGDLTVRPRTRLMSAPSAMLARHARTTERLANGAGGTVLSSTASRVGILASQPQEALEVGGAIKASSARVAGDVSVAGSFTANLIDALGVAPIGSVAMWSGNVPPRGWALCDGRVVNGRQTPDLRGRFILGAGQGQGLTARTAGQPGGAEAYKLTPGELPAHDHVYDAPSTTTSTDGAHTHAYISGFRAPGPVHQAWDFARPDWNIGAYVKTNRTSINGNHEHRLTFPATTSMASGGDRPHPSIPPFHVLAFIMRVE